MKECGTYNAVSFAEVLIKIDGIIISTGTLCKYIYTASPYEHVAHRSPEVLEKKPED